MNAESGCLGGSRLLQILRAFGEYMREPPDQTGVAVCGADCRQDAGSETAKRGHAAGAAQRQIIYQANVTTGKPDFLYVDEERPLILDTKYKPRYRNKRTPWSPSILARCSTNLMKRDGCASAPCSQRRRRGRSSHTRGLRCTLLPKTPARRRLRTRS